MITQQDLGKQKEQIQQDLMTILDGIDDEVLTAVCQVIVDRFTILSSKME